MVSDTLFFKQSWLSELQNGSDLPKIEFESKIRNVRLPTHTRSAVTGMKIEFKNRDQNSKSRIPDNFAIIQN